MNRTKSEQRKATLAGREVNYRITMSPRATRARIRVGPAGVEVVVPRSAPAGRAAKFLTEQADWVVRQLDRAESVGSIRRPASVPEPGTVMLRGVRVRVRVAVTPARRFARVHQYENGLTVSVPQRMKASVGQVVEKWLRRQARGVIEARVEVWSKALKRTPYRVYIRGQRTKWGNCSKLRNLSFNWRLVMAPERTLDAIVIHELAHLIEPTHETRFWLLVRSHCPDYDARVRWLRENEAALFAPVNNLAPAG